MPTINGGRITPGTGEVSYREEPVVDNTVAPSSGATTPPSNIMTVRGRNVGRIDDLGLYLKSTGTQDIVLDFKSLRAGAGIGLTNDSESVLIYNSRVIANAGTGAGLVLGDVGSETRIASLRGENGVTVSLDGSVMVVGIDQELGIVAGRGLVKTGSVLDLTQTGVAPGSYALARFMVDTTGRITAASSSNVVNIGGGHAVYAGRSMADDLQFRSFQAGPGVELSSSTDAITIGMSTDVLGGANIGSGTGVFAGMSGTTHQFKSLMAGDGVVLTSDTDAITIGMSTDVLGGANIGSGAGVFAGMSGNAHQFKSLMAGDGVVLTSDTDEITIGMSTDVLGGANIGSGAGVFAGMSGTTHQFKSLMAGSGVVVTSDADAITIGMSTDVLGGANIGSGAGVFAGMSGTAHRFKSLKAGSGVVVTSDADEIFIASTGEGVTSVAAGDGLTGGVITGTGTIALGDSGVIPGTYAFPTVTVDRHGRVVEVQSAGAVVATKLQTPRTIALTGKVTGSTTFDGSANANIATSLALTSNDVTGALGYNPARTNAAQTFSGQQNTAMVTLTGPAASWNLEQSNVFKLGLDSNATVTITSGMVAGGTYMIIVEQTGTGGHTITWESRIKWPSGVVIQPSPTAGSWSIYSFVSDGDRLFAVGVTNY